MNHAAWALAAKSKTTTKNESARGRGVTREKNPDWLRRVFTDIGFRVMTPRLQGDCPVCGRRSAERGMNFEAYCLGCTFYVLAKAGFCDLLRLAEICV